MTISHIHQAHGTSESERQYKWNQTTRTHRRQNSILSGQANMETGTAHVSVTCSAFCKA